MLVIEHNLDVIKSADWVIDRDPWAALRAAKILATGTPEQVAGGIPQSCTGKYLGPILKERMRAHGDKPSDQRQAW